MDNLERSIHLANRAERRECRYSLAFTVAGYTFCLTFDNVSAYESMAFRTELLVVNNEPEDSFNIRICSDSSLDCSDSCFLSDEKKGYLIVREWDYETVRQVPDNVALLIYRMLKSRGFNLLHAAVIGKDEQGILIGGSPYSGKTILALSSLAAGMDFLSDDKILLDTEKHRAYPLFSVFTVKNDTVQLLPEIFEKTGNKREGKLASSYSLAPFEDKFRRSLQIVAIVLPIKNSLEEPVLTRLSAANAISPIAFSGATLFGLKSINYLRDTWKSLSDIPAFSLRAGWNLQANVKEMNKVFDYILEKK